MANIPGLSAGLTALRTTWDLVTKAIETRDDLKIAEATQQLTFKILDVQNAALDLQEKTSAMRDEIEALKNDKRQLETAITDLEQRKSDRAQYALKEIHKGSFVLAYQGAGDGSTPSHYLCQPCMDNSAKKVVLQVEKKNWQVNLVCNVCDTSVFTGETYTMPPLNTTRFR